MADTLLREGIAFQSQPLSPIPQYWTGTAYEKVQGVNGASRNIIYDASGVALFTTTNTGKVAIQSALPAGTNNIGDVDVLTLPALPAGTNNIGDVDVLSLPPLPTGTNNIGDVDVLTLPELPSGTNNIGDVDIATVPVIGVHANAWNNIAVGIGGTSAVIDCQYQRTISAFGNVSAATTIKVQVSQDGTNFYDSGSEQVLAGAADFHITLDTGARYIQLHSSAAATITATTAGK